MRDHQPQIAIACIQVGIIMRASTRHDIRVRVQGGVWGGIVVRVSGTSTRDGIVLRVSGTSTRDGIVVHVSGTRDGIVLRVSIQESIVVCA